MPGPFEELTNLDRVVHEPGRLAILTALEACRTADFRYLQSVTALNSGTLSRHLQTLETAGLVAVKKGYRGRVPHMTLRLTRQGREAIGMYWRRLDALRRSTQESRSLVPSSGD